MSRKVLNRKRCSLLGPFLRRCLSLSSHLGPWNESHKLSLEDQEGWVPGFHLHRREPSWHPTTVWILLSHIMSPNTNWYIYYLWDKLVTKRVLEEGWQHHQWIIIQKTWTESGRFEAGTQRQTKAWRGRGDEWLEIWWEARATKDYLGKRMGGKDFAKEVLRMEMTNIKN